MVNCSIKSSLANRYVLLGTSNSTSQDHTINLSAGDRLSKYQAFVITLAYNNSSIVSSTMFFDSMKNVSTSYYDKNTSVSDMAQYIAVSDTQFKMYTNAATWYGNLYGIR